MKGYSKRDNKDGEYHINHTSNKDGCRYYQGNDTSPRGVCRNIEKTPEVVDCCGSEDKCSRVIEAKKEDIKKTDVNVTDAKITEMKIIETKKNMK